MPILSPGIFRENEAAVFSAAVLFSLPVFLFSAQFHGYTAEAHPPASKGRPPAETRQQDKAGAVRTENIQG